VKQPPTTTTTATTKKRASPLKERNEKTWREKNDSGKSPLRKKENIT
jgi:hypothetical protein